MEGYEGEEITEGSEKFPDEFTKDVKTALDNLINMAMFLEIAKGADIKSSPIIQEVAMTIDDDADDSIKGGDRAFRITVQEIEKEEMQEL